VLTLDLGTKVAWDANGVCTHHDSVPGTMMNSASLKGSCPKIMALLNACVHLSSSPQKRLLFCLSTCDVQL
jgi:hypothetical protein